MGNGQNNATITATKSFKDTFIDAAFEMLGQEVAEIKQNNWRVSWPAKIANKLWDFGSSVKLLGNIRKNVEAKSKNLITESDVSDKFDSSDIYKKGSLPQMLVGYKYILNVIKHLLADKNFDYKRPNDLFAFAIKDAAIAGLKAKGWYPYIPNFVLDLLPTKENDYSYLQNFLPAFFEIYNKSEDAKKVVGDFLSFAELALNSISNFANKNSKYNDYILDALLKTYFAPNKGTAKEKEALDALRKHINQDKKLMTEMTEIVKKFKGYLGTQEGNKLVIPFNNDAKGNIILGMEVSVQGDNLNISVVQCNNILQTVTVNDNLEIMIDSQKSDEFPIIAIMSMMMKPYMSNNRFYYTHNNTYPEIKAGEEVADFANEAPSVLDNPSTSSDNTESDSLTESSSQKDQIVVGQETDNLPVVATIQQNDDQSGYDSDEEFITIFDMDELDFANPESEQSLSSSTSTSSEGAINSDPIELSEDTQELESVEELEVDYLNELKKYVPELEEFENAESFSKLEVETIVQKFAVILKDMTVELKEMIVKSNKLDKQSLEEKAELEQQVQVEKERNRLTQENNQLKETLKEAREVIANKINEKLDNYYKKDSWLVRFFKWFTRSKDNANEIETIKEQCVNYQNGDISKDDFNKALSALKEKLKKKNYTFESSLKRTVEEISFLVK